MRDVLLFVVVAALSASAGWWYQSTRAQPVDLQPSLPVQGGLINAPQATSSEGAPTSASSSSAASSRPRVRFGKRKEHDEISGAKPSRQQLPDGAIQLNFSYLADWKFYVLDPKDDQKVIPGPAPANIRELDGQLVKIKGYLAIAGVEDKKITAFQLMRYSYDQCCFGIVPKPHEWIEVKVDKRRAPPLIMDRALMEVQGVLEVGHKRTEFGQLISFYRMKAKHIWVVRR